MTDGVGLFLFYKKEICAITKCSNPRTEYLSGLNLTEALFAKLV